MLWYGRMGGFSPLAGSSNGQMTERMFIEIILLLYSTFHCGSQSSVDRVARRLPLSHSLDAATMPVSDAFAPYSGPLWTLRGKPVPHLVRPVWWYLDCHCAEIKSTTLLTWVGCLQEPCKRGITNLLILFREKQTHAHGGEEDWPLSEHFPNTFPLSVDGLNMD